MENNDKKPKENFIKNLDSSLRESRHKQYVKMFKYLPIISNCIIFSPIIYIAMASFLLSDGKLVDTGIEQKFLLIPAIVIVSMAFNAKLFIDLYFKKKEKNGEKITIQDMFQYHVTSLSSLGLPSFAGLLLSFSTGDMLWVITMSAISIAASFIFKPDITQFESYNEIKEEYDL